MKIKKSPEMVLFPCPVVLVTCIDSDGKPNIITIAWVGTVCSDPPTLGLGIRPKRYFYKLVEDSGEFVVNIPRARDSTMENSSGVDIVMALGRRKICSSLDKPTADTSYSQ